MKKINGSNLKKIVNLDGIHLRFAILTSLKRIEKKKNYLNKINLFPIPDKDTGTNLFHTLKAVCKEMVLHNEPSISLTSALIARTALSGAQGYSGTILAHFFHGFSRGAENKVCLSTTDFATASRLACQSARDAISDPQEGTLLSVLRDWSAIISEKAEITEDFIDLFSQSLSEAKKSLADTRNILPVLQNAGVVDAGAQGFVYLLEGILNSIKRRNSKEIHITRTLKKGLKTRQVDMDIQNIQSPTPKKRIGIVTDSSCDLPDHFMKDNQIHVIPLKISFGNKTYLDKIQITPSEFYQKLVRSSHHPKTSQPALADVDQLFNEVVPIYDHILCIHLPRVLSGTIQVVEKAARKYQSKITCIDGRNISAALGLVVMEAVKTIKLGCSLDMIIKHIHNSIENIKLFIVLPTVKYLVKGGRLSKPKGLIGRLLRLNPIVTFNKEGRIHLLSKAIGNRNTLQKALSMIADESKQYKKITFMVAHADAPQKAKWVASQLYRLFQIKEPIEIVEAAPVLGVHAGPGTVGFGFIGYHE
ncbi:MAG: DegV family EDD domain-containing protein [Candidatus Aminicenantes bacterium]|nr:DegV family EDD domain-containing protein [Candidatus Aminicenantes bacterium]